MEAFHHIAYWLRCPSHITCRKSEQQTQNLFYVENTGLVYRELYGILSKEKECRLVGDLILILSGEMSSSNSIYTNVHAYILWVDKITKHQGEHGNRSLTLPQRLLSFNSDLIILSSFFYNGWWVVCSLLITAMYLNYFYLFFLVGLG